VWYGHNFAEDLLDECGYQAVVEALDQLTEAYGDLLDARESVPGRYGGTQPGSYLVKNPAGMITHHARRRAARHVRAATDVQHLRVVNDRRQRQGGAR